MEFILYNKTHPVCKLEIDQSGIINKVIDTYEKEYAPVGVALTDKLSLHEWWKGRSIPASRAGLSKLLLNLNITSSSILPLKSLGLSLSDQYWIKPTSSDITWSQVNFFENPFSNDVGEAFFNEDFKANINLMSPDNTSDGWLPKKWIIQNGDIYLVKAGSKPYYQEPYNEVIASKIMEQLNIGPYVKYSLVEDDTRGICCACENFIDTNTELVPAYALYKSLPKAAETSTFEHFLNIEQEFNIPRLRESLENMIVLDYIIANEDRHAGNFGVIRNVDSLNYIGCAPIYDSGTSLWHNSQAHEIGATITARPFYSSHEEQLKLVQSWDRFDFSKLDALPEEVTAILNKNPENLPKRTNTIAQAVKERVASIKLHQLAARKVFATTEAFKTAAVKEFKGFKLTTEPTYAYYRDYCGAAGKKYNPELDKKIYGQMLKDGLNREYCRKAIINSPHIKSTKMVDILERSLKRVPELKKFFPTELER